MQYIENFLVNPIVGIVAALVLTVVGWKMNQGGADYMLLLAWCLLTVSVFRAPPISTQVLIQRILLTALVSLAAGLGLCWLSGWNPSTASSTAGPVAEPVDDTKPPAPALAFGAIYVGIRNMPERKMVPTWNKCPWDEANYADLRLTITNTLGIALQDLELEIDVAEGNPKIVIAGIAQLTTISGVEFSKPSLQVPALPLKGDDGKTYYFPFGDELTLPTRKYEMFCPRLGKGGIIRLILAAGNIGEPGKPPSKIKLSGTYVTESTQGRMTGQISNLVSVTQ